MSDIADDADNQSEKFTEWAMAQKKPEGPKYTGFCANCGEVVAEPKRWCDTDCRDEEQKRARRMYGAY